jgi:hypothetical protein
MGPVATLSYFQGTLFDTATVYGSLTTTTIFTTPSLATGIWKIVYQHTVRVTGGVGNSLDLIVSAGTASVTALSALRSTHTPPNNFNSFTVSPLIQVTSPGTVTMAIFNNGLTMNAAGASGNVGISYYAIKIA